ncbi:uncharacterized protein N7479_003465 [Penicillium vulpinum]|uniref:Aldehyde dehydrogenase n=1 Tax=Penicillium vulpinum TaxID=29845 RepID=A0A1V6RWX7_9EURO|nr:uncharacterized protein N7479_003465 [Penicillium vulpinum]KAJ5963589.1 hypothetical protein N7479_003465 [Penicillium vulpinum]OQE06030.1 hypothetical protein PENVUL_c020G03835 [Penicillium vulpinum]
MDMENRYESAEEIQTFHSILVSKFRTGQTKDLAWRKWQLKQLWWLVEDNEQAILDAIKADLNRSEVESYLTDLAGIRKDIIYHLDNIDAWAADEIIGDSFIARRLGLARIRKEPLGVVLIIGAWNFPVLLVLQPLIAAITAGCCAIIKPSEVAVACQNLLRDLVTQYLDPTAIRLVCAGVPETTKLLELPFNHIFFTGSANVGRHISAAAAIHLTPVTMELGGQSPAIIGRSADVERAAKSIAYAKFLNAGQICLTVNHVFVDAAVHDVFVDRLQYWNSQFLHGEKTITTAIVNQQHWKRLFGLLHQTKGTIVSGGSGNDESRRMEPAVVVDLDMDDPLLSEEIFGPICPVIKANVRQACQRINKGEHPLALYIFSSDSSEIQDILDNTNSGGVTINDVILHAGFPGAPFGGVGGSGHGYYHGPYGFKSFSHLRTIMSSPKWFDRLISFRYPPFSAAKKAKIPQTKAKFKRGETIQDQRRAGSGMVGSKLAAAAALCGIAFYYYYYSK